MRVAKSAFLAAQAGIPTVLVGDYGIGKSTVNYQFAKFWLRRNGFDEENVIHFPMVGALTEDLIGYPEIQDDPEIGKVTVNIPHQRIRKLINGGVVLLLEELNRGDERIQNAVAQILDGELGQFGKRAEILVLATMNKHGRGIYELNENIISRMAFYNCTIDNTEEQLAIMTGRYNTDSKFTPLPDNWKDYIPIVRSWMAGFYQVRSSAFVAPHGFDFTEPWPNPRSRDKLAVPTLAALLSVGQPTSLEIEDALKATMGTSFALEFSHWYSTRDYPDPRKILDEIIHGNSPKFSGGVPAFISVFGEILYIIKTLPKERAVISMEKVLNYFGKSFTEADVPEAYLFTVFLYLQEKELVRKVPVSLAPVYNKFKERW